MKKNKLIKVIVLLIIISSFSIGCGIENREERREKREEGAENREERREKREEGAEKSKEVIGNSQEGQTNTLFNDEYIELNYIEKIETDDKEWNIYKCKIINNFDKTITITYRDSKEKNTYSSMDINSNEEKEICYMLDNEEIKKSMFSIYLTNDIEPHLLKDYYISF